MIISRTPFRVSFFGGGTDYPAWFKDHPGAVLATTIDKYCYLTCRYLPPFFEHKSRVVYSQVELVKKTSEIRHPAVRAGLEFLNIDEGVEIHHDGDLPARTGLGSSSAFTVGLLHSLYALKGEMPTKEQLAKEAIYVEQKMCNDHVGCQDQILASYGGMNIIEFGPHEDFRINRFVLSKENQEKLQDHLMLFFTGFARYSSEVAETQIKQMPRKNQEMKRIYELVWEGTEAFKKGDMQNIAKLLQESWMIKRSLSSKITTARIDQIYETGIKAGAWGGKLLGAGGGGFILFLAPPTAHKRIREKLKSLLYVPFKFENLGTNIIFHQPNAEILLKE